MRKPVLLVLALLVVATGCRDYLVKSDRVVVAECYGNKLYAEDLAGVVSAEANRLDSFWIASKPMASI